MRLRENQSTQHAATPALRLKPLAQAIALLLFAGSAQAAPAAFSSAWFAAKGATQAAGVARPGAGAQLPGTPPPLAQQAKVNQQLQRSLTNMNNTVAAIAAQQAAQAAGRKAAFAQAPTVPDGLGEGGLKIDGSMPFDQAWQNAKGPVQTQANGKTHVGIEQTADKAILNWETFNVGRNTTVEFQQQADWAVLNRVNDPNARPSQIQGQIKGDGTVMIANANGVVFSGTSQVNVRNLVAAAANISDSQFTNNGLYGANNAATFTNAGGAVTVEPGALIETAKPGNSTTGGGYVLLLGKEVDNAGSIATAKGQTALAAGDSFIIKKGQATDGNQASTTRGNEITATGSGSVRNSGLLQAATGDITLTGNQVEQNGVALASTSVDLRGTVHLAANGTNGKVTLGEGATTAILLEDSDVTALDSQRDSLLAPAVDTSADDQNIVAADKYRRDQSLVEIASSGTVDFQDGSITLATGGQVAVNAGTRALMRDGAVIDVAGATGVKVAMESNSVKVNIQGNEQRDASVNRDDGSLNNNDVWVDVRDLVFVPAGTNGYETDRWYTAGGLLEVGGYLGTTGHSAGEWMAQGGTVSFTGNEVVTQGGSQINLSGGTLDVQDGYIQQTWLKGADGKLYELSRAPGDILYTGLYKGYEDVHARWGQTDYYYNPLIAPRQRFEAGYTVGRDAGTLVIGTKSAVLEGTLVGDTFQGDRQTQAAQAGLDGYHQSQKAVARGANLVVGSYTPYYVKDSGTLQHGLTATANTLQDVILGTASQKIAAGLELDSVLPEDREGTLYLDSDQLSGFELGSVKIAARNGITVDGELSVGPAGEITLYGPQVNVNADLTSHGGTIRLGNVLNQVSANARIEDTTLSAPSGTTAGVTVAEGVALDASGLWSNLLLEPENIANLPYQDGGSVSIRSIGDVTLAQGSVVDVSSGAALLADGKRQGGKGGDVTLAAAQGTGSPGELTLDGELRAYGVNGGGRLDLQAKQVQIGDSPAELAPGTLLLDGDFFDKGFSHYAVVGQQGLTVADDTRVDVTMPVYRFGENALASATGGDPAMALDVWTPPLYQEDPVDAVLAQRRGASLALQAGSGTSVQADIPTTRLHVGRGAEINVDPGQSIVLQGIGQITVDGTLNAWGGRIELRQGSVSGGGGSGSEDAYTADDGRSFWIGETAVLDVAARAVTAVDAQGRRYGLVRNGGSIVIGGTIDHEARNATLPVPFVVVREGALLDASGAQATLNIAGQGATSIASHGGSISLASSAGLYLDGDMRANAGGVGAAGGSLSLATGARSGGPQTPDRLRQVYELVVGQKKSASDLPLGIDADEAAQDLIYGHARLGIDQVEAGGFDTLSLFSQGMIAFDGDVNLALGQGLNLYAGALGLTETAAVDSRIDLAAPYIRLAGSVAASVPDAPGYFRMGMNHSVPGLGLSQQPLAGQLRLEAGSLLEVEAGDGLGFGGNFTLLRQDGEAQGVDRRAFDAVELVSQGDMRFKTGVLHTPGDLLLAAAQIYPGTGAVAEVHAGYRGRAVAYDPQRVLSLARTTETIPGVPYSAFGSLSLGAATINQGGVVRAPLGTLVVGYEWSSQRPLAVNLLPGSLTSASGAGLVMPYGGTVDGVTWEYNDQEIELVGIGEERASGITLRGQAVDVQEGAVLDLSGGGELTGAAFVSGRGGSTDARYHPLVQIGPDGFTLPGLGSNPVYAIVPGVQAVAAPAGGEAGAVDPLVGQQVTLGAGVPGLPAGTYTLLPSTYALLPGAYRVEVNGLAGQGAAAANAAAMRNGSWSTSGVLSIAGTGIRDNLASHLILTPADVLRSYSQYNEMSYADFVRADAALIGVPRAMIEADARTLRLRLADNGEETVSFSFDGIGHFDAAKDGYGGTLSLTVGSTENLEILAAGTRPTAGFQGVSVYANDLNAAGAKRLVVGNMNLTYATRGNPQGANLVSMGGGAKNLVVRSGAQLMAPEVVLTTTSSASPTNLGSLVIEDGARIDTLGLGPAPFDSTDGYLYVIRSGVAVSNGQLTLIAAAPTNTPTYASPVKIGGCLQTTCAGAATLYSEGTIVFSTEAAFELADSVRYGTRHLSLGMAGINVGSAQALAAASARGALTSGLTLNQDVMKRLLQGDTSAGAPALETLSLTARDALNFYESVTLSTLDENGESLLDNLLLTTPAIYGYGAADDVALIQTGNLIWNGSANLPGAVAAGGAGTGIGTLAIEAERIELGYGPYTQPSGVDDLARLALGFANVDLTASERITANNTGNLAVYQSQGAYVESEGHSYSGGNLNIVTPLISGTAGSVNRITAGGAVTVAAPQDGGAGEVVVGADALGAELALSGQRIVLDTAVVLPSGKLSLTAEDDLTLADGALIDMAGRSVEFFDDEEATQYSWGGDVVLESRAGDIRQAAGSVIDLSAEYNQGGRLTAIALGEGAGVVDLQGRILASASGYTDAGGTLVPHLVGGVDIRAQRLGGSGSLSEQFAALNQRLNEGEVFGLRSFQLKQGDLVIGDGLKANEINVSLDNGRLTVSGTVDASGERVGSIRLAGKHGLTIGGNAVLDAHGTLLRLDSYGQIIDSPNRAIVELSSGDGLLTLANGARIDLRHGTDDARVTAAPALHDGRDRGTLELNAPRLGGATAGDVAIDASGSLDIQGARSIAVNAVQRYDDASYGSDPAASARPYQVIDQAYLDAKHADSTAFINAALGNSGLLNDKLAGLNNAAYADAFHLRPGVEVVSATANGDLIVSGDLDLSGHRYASLNPHTQRTGIYGSGEVGALVMRAGGDLEIYGSINDGFAPPPETPDDSGWQLTPGYIAYGGDLVVPGPGVTLANGTEFAAGKTLNYDLPIGVTQFAAGTQLPVQGELNAALTLPAGTVLRAAVRDASGNVLHAAGAILSEATTLPSGSRLDAGTVLPAQATLRAMTWPKGVALPAKLVLAGNLALQRGALIPSETLVKLPDDAISIPLRPADGSRQGANWAVAAMLPEGSQSWSMRIVAGADTQAADTRAVRVDAKGNMILADTHYSLFEQRERTVIPGTPPTTTGVWYWNELASIFDPGFVANTPVPAELESWCSAGVCTLVQYVWNDLAPIFDPGFIPGTPVPDSEMAWCTSGVCDQVGETIPGTPEQVVIGDVIRSHPVAQNFSVLRTGTGDLDLIAGGDLGMQSLYGVYTAGTSTSSQAGSQAADFDQPRAKASDGSYLGTGNNQDADIAAAYEALVDGGANSPYAAWYPGQGGNLLVRAGGDLTGDMLSASHPLDEALARPLRGQSSSANLGNWLWRQGTGDTASVEPMPTSWWINFGSYVPGGTLTNAFYQYADHPVSDGEVESVPELIGFTGFGTLGGGNLTVDVMGDAGMLALRGDGADQAPRSQGLALAVGSTGRVTADGELLLTGGGDMSVRIGGDLNPGLQARATGNEQNTDLTGAWTNLRGALLANAGALGGIALNYGSTLQANDAKETRAYDPFTSTQGRASGGPVLMLGDAVASLSTRGDLVLSGTGDPGRVAVEAGPAYDYNGGSYPTAGEAAYRLSGGAAVSWFSLWTENTAINLFSAGGNLTPSVQASAPSGNGQATGGRYIFPSQLASVAANGSIFLGSSAAYVSSATEAGRNQLQQSLLLAPSVNGSLELLAGDSIYAGGYAVNQSGAGIDVVPTPLRPAFALFTNSLTIGVSNLSADAIRPDLGGTQSLFAFGPNTSAGAAWGSAEPARFYAADGDIVGLRTGEILEFTLGGRQGQTWYESAGPVWMMAGRDIVASGTPLGESTSLPQAIVRTLTNNTGSGTSTGNLFVHNDPNDVSIVSAGRDILYSSFNVAGPGTLEISAGRNILMADRASITSLGPVVPGDSRPGASIVMQAGFGEHGADYLGFARRYLDPANLADPAMALADQDGKVAHTYEAELIEWLEQRYGFSGDAEQALTFYAALPAEQQRIFARQVYFAELREGGREYNDADGPRLGSYLRGRNAIAALFPSHDVAGNPVAYGGEILMYGGAGVHTDVGGDIQMLTPGGAQTFGVEGEAPPSTAGVITRGQGDIQLYSVGSILLGQSRIMTTFGGDILAWSAEGDINAGRGSKTTVVYTPPRRVYDAWGNVTLSPTVPSTGAGIATLNPIAEVPPGDIDLLAPLGTIDAGEAGIRVSGNVNIAALQVVNAANIQVQGEATGIPVVAAVNTGALTSASSAASTATQVVDEVVRQGSSQRRPSVFSVQVLGFGDERLEPSREEARRAPGYRPTSSVQVLGAGQLDERAMDQLTEEERGRLSL
ncbi:filamentous hemagglutinin family protein [Stutzerimonas nitrititolerans]|uniref:filamentous hemagglutinin family protein n=1 Tax=Stutzerimonas nitrititolerans TaxID=2482751 RepID=UPI00289B02AF|nr:filamentous hemagglutinin family protein [Stutzerimonas nitrititolerans]